LRIAFAKSSDFVVEDGFHADKPHLALNCYAKSRNSVRSPAHGIGISPTSFGTLAPLHSGAPVGDFKLKGVDGKSYTQRRSSSRKPVSMRRSRSCAC
jgi:hypothetical protein